MISQEFMTIVEKQIIAIKKGCPKKTAFAAIL